MPLSIVEVRQRLPGGVLAPVVGVLHDREVVVRDPVALELERAGADHVLEAVLAVIELLLAHDAEAAVLVEVGRERRPRRLHVDAHRHRVDDGDVRDVVEHEDEEQRRTGRELAAVRIEVVLDDLGVERRAVGELDARANLDGPRLVVGAGRDRRRQIGDVIALVVGHGEVVVQRAGHLDAGDGELRLGQAPTAGGLRVERERDVATLDRLRLALVHHAGDRAALVGDLVEALGVVPRSARGLAGGAFAAAPARGKQHRGDE
jgi:hypothetical protein